MTKNERNQIHSLCKFFVNSIPPKTGEKILEHTVKKKQILLQTETEVEEIMFTV